MTTVVPPRTVIRRARDDDAAAVSALLRQIGYPASLDETRGRLRHLAGSAADAVFVAERDGAVVGVAGMHCIPLLHQDGSVGRLTALAVDLAVQGDGVGRSLVEASELFAREAGCRRFEVTSGAHRRDAHAFYERIGYRVSAHRRFTKSFASRDAGASPD